ncbi:hypothetical protein [Bacillus wiedmannii]|uniref:hypothetical protein n=1 Tax=Bacillus wiedmannii TaxID=1890302 RepID=UPI0021D0B89D|nr:hypothetical protein [Bacillus wiedmannii]MCU5097271.1 hypothetical protein [Bacillus wiedmannii]
MKLRGIPGNGWGSKFRNNYLADQADIEQGMYVQNKRIDTLVLSASEKEVMANDACLDKKGNVFPTLKARNDNTDLKIEYTSINLLDFNASELATDNAEAIQTAIDYATFKNLELVFPREKTFIIKKTVKIHDNTKINFNLSTLKRAKGEVFDLITNDNHENGNTNIRLRNLLQDGNRKADNLNAVIVAERFCGLRLVRVKKSELNIITVINTVNAEEQNNDITKKPAAGIFFDLCEDIDCYKLNGMYNDRTAIFLNRSKRVKIYGSITNDNKGSGISSANSPECEYYDILSFNNGYSNISVNGMSSKVGDITTYGSAYSGLNIGHDQYSSHGTQIFNVHSYGNSLEGVTIGASDNVLMTNIETYNNSRNNIRIFQGSNSCKLVNVIARNSAGGSGFRIDSGINHTLTAVEAYENFLHGIFVGENVNVTVNSDVKAYNNGKGQSVDSAGLCLNKSLNCKVLGGEFYDL